MNIFKLIGELVVIYVLYNIIFKFIIPLYKASKQMKGTFNNMKEKMQEQQKAQQSGPSFTEETPKKQPNKTGGDYIDYEEVK